MYTLSVNKYRSVTIPCFFYCETNENENVINETLNLDEFGTIGNSITRKSDLLLSFIV